MRYRAVRRSALRTSEHAQRAAATDENQNMASTRGEGAIDAKVTNVTDGEGANDVRVTNVTDGEGANDAKVTDGEGANDAKVTNVTDGEGANDVKVTDGEGANDVKVTDGEGANFAHHPNGEEALLNLSSNREAEAIAKENEELLKHPLDVDACIKKLTANETKGQLISLEEIEVRAIIARVEKILMSQPMLLELDSPVKIVADIHGQFTDLLRLFELIGWPPKANYLFLGDMVDRGPQQTEVVLLLFLYKIKHPGNMFLLRGNHESGSLHRRYGFQGECKSRYSLKTWRAFVECFNCLPAAALVDEKIFCCHGGLSPELMKGEGLDKIRNLPRPTDVPDEGLLCDLMWADPDGDVTNFQESDRGVSYLFGAAIVEKFLDKYDLDLICRGHQVETDGYSFFADRQLVTLFSAPNYCGEFDNAGGIMTVEEDLTCSFQVLPPVSEKTAKKKRKSKSNNRNTDEFKIHSSGNFQAQSENLVRTPTGPCAVCLVESCEWCYGPKAKSKKKHKIAFRIGKACTIC